MKPLEKYRNVFIHNINYGHNESIVSYSDMTKAFDNGFSKFTKEDFKAIVLAVIPSANQSYINEKWVSFNAMPINYIYTRSPIEQGELILKKILMYGGLNEKRLQ